MGGLGSAFPTAHCPLPHCPLLSTPLPTANFPLPLTPVSEQVKAPWAGVF